MRKFLYLLPLVFTVSNSYAKDIFREGMNHNWGVSWTHRNVIRGSADSPSELAKLIFELHLNDKRPGKNQPHRSSRNGREFFYFGGADSYYSSEYFPAVGSNRAEYFFHFTVQPRTWFDVNKERLKSQGKIVVSAGRPADYGTYGGHISDEGSMLREPFIKQFADFLVDSGQVFTRTSEEGNDVFLFEWQALNVKIVKDKTYAIQFVVDETEGDSTYNPADGFYIDQFLR